MDDEPLLVRRRRRRFSAHRRILSTTRASTMSTAPRKKATTTVTTITTTVELMSSCRLGQVTLRNSAMTSPKNSFARLKNSIVVRSCSSMKWQGWRDSNPHPPDLESGALAVRATPLGPLLRFLVRRVLAAPPAVLLQLEPVGVRAPVLGGRVVPPLALSTRQSDDLAHGLLRDLRDDARPHRPPALPDREPQLLLHRHRLDQLDRHRHVVAGHHHLHPPPPRVHPRHPRPPHAQLPPSPVEKRRVPPPPLPPPHRPPPLAPLCLPLL